ncbi:MAG: PepSY domain-containing protein [Alphaproteobacteria bacterium]
MRKWIARLHKWASVIIGLQILAWVVSGLYMTAIPIEQVRSEHRIREQKPADLRGFADIIPAQRAMAALGSATVTRLELRAWLDRPVYEAGLDGGGAALIDGRNGELISPLDEMAARAVAESDYAGTGTVGAVRLIEKDSHIEYRGPLPVWQISFDDADELRLYVSPATGKVVARRSEVWRIYDFLWSLHIMDYSKRENFNHPLVIVATAAALFLVGTGAVLVYQRFVPAGALRRRPRKKVAKVAS